MIIFLNYLKPIKAETFIKGIELLSFISKFKKKFGQANFVPPKKG